MKNKFLGVFLPVLLVFLLVGCDLVDSNMNDEGVSSATGTHIVTDMSGAEVEISSEINRVISVNQAFCGFMTAMGIPDKLIGSHGSVLNHSWSPIFYEGFSNMDRYGYQPAPEAIYKAKADLVVLNDALYAEELRNAGIPAIYFNYTNKDELYKALDLMGDIFGDAAVEYTNNWKKYLDTTIAEIGQNISLISVEERKSVYFVNAAVAEATDEGIYNTFGGGSFVEYWINTIGADLVTSPYKNATQLDPEIVLSMDPDVILCSGYLEYQYRDLIRASVLWRDKKAVKSDSIYVIPTSMISYDRFAVELPFLLRYSANLLYPDYCEFNALEELDSFYHEYYGRDFSEGELNNMLAGLNPDGTVMGT